MVTEPKVETRAAQHTAGIRTTTSLPDFTKTIEATLPEVFQWLQKKGIAPAGAPFIRYHIIDMTTELDVEFGLPVASPITGDERVKPGELPAGRYANILYTGHYSGLMDANRVLVEWAAQNGIAWDHWDDPKGDAFRSRYESYITDPGDEPDSSKWQTEVLIKVADK